MINTEEKNRLGIGEVFRQIKWTSILLCIVGALMGRVCLFGQFYTLGICYVGALFGDKEIRKWGALMTILGLTSIGFFRVEVVSYILMIILLMCLRFYMQITKTKFNGKNQAILTGICILLIKFIGVFVSGMTIFKIVSSLLEAAIGGSLVIILSYSTNLIVEKKRTILSDQELMSMALFLVLILGGMIDFSIQVPVFKSIYFIDVVVFLIIIGITYLGGVNKGLISSIIMSTVLVVIGYMPSNFVAVYAIGVLIGGLFSVLGKLGIIIATGMGILLGFALFNNEVIDYSIVGAYLVGGGISICIPKNYLGLVNWFDQVDNVQSTQYSNRTQMLVMERLKYFSKAWRQLANSFDKMSQKKTYLGPKDIQYIVDDTGKRVCTNCAMRKFCFKDYIRDTYNYGYIMIAAIEKKGQLTVGDIPEGFKKVCLNADNFACILEFELDLYKENMLWQNRFVEVRGLVGGQFEAVAKSIDKISTQIEGEYFFDEEEEITIKNILNNNGIKTKEVMVLQNKGRIEEIHIYMEYRPIANLKEKVITYVQEGMKLILEMENYKVSTEEKTYYMKLKVKKAFNVTAHCMMQAKEKVSGDTYSMMELSNHNYLLALADGMGSGEAAMKQSKTTIEIFENLLEAGFEHDEAIKMINSILVLKSDSEIFSTMDITLIDEYTGVAEFLKMGAASSFILRGQEIITVKSRSLPIGILNYVEVQSYREQLREGDTVIMVTDGVLESKEDLLGKEETFKHFIREAENNTPEYLSKYLMEKCVGLLGGGERDDMTILVARIWKKY